MRRVAFLFVVGVVALIGGSAVAFAQAAPRPAVERADLTATVQADNSAQVSIEYIIVNSEGLADQRVVHNLATFPNVTIEGLRATGAGGANLQVAREERPGFDRLTVQLPSGTTGAVTYTLEYTARANRDDFRFPVPVPNFPVRASVISFFATVTLPPGMNFHGDEFPRVVEMTQQGNSTVLRMQEVNIPAFIVASFGEGGAPIGNATNLTTLVSFLFIVAAATWWWQLKAGK
jgi:hypothetical protein